MYASMSIVYGNMPVLSIMVLFLCRYIGGLLCCLCSDTVYLVTQILTAGADKLCAMWDVEYHEPVRRYEGHHADILGWGGGRGCIHVYSVYFNFVYNIMHCDIP